MVEQVTEPLTQETDTQRRERILKEKNLGIGSVVRLIQNEDDVPAHLLKDLGNTIMVIKFIEYGVMTLWGYYDQEFHACIAPSYVEKVSDEEIEEIDRMKAFKSIIHRIFGRMCGEFQKCYSLMPFLNNPEWFHPDNPILITFSVTQDILYEKKITRETLTLQSRPLDSITELKKAVEELKAMCNKVAGKYCVSVTFDGPYFCADNNGQLLLAIKVGRRSQ